MPDPHDEQRKPDGPRDAPKKAEVEPAPEEADDDGASDAAAARESAEAEKLDGPDQPAAEGPDQTDRAEERDEGDEGRPAYVRELEAKESQLETAREKEKECIAARAALEADITARRKRALEIGNAVAAYAGTVSRFKEQYQALKKYCEKQSKCVDDEVRSRVEQIKDEAKQQDLQLDEREQELDKRKIRLTEAEQELAEHEQAAEEARQAYRDLKDAHTSTAAALDEMQRLLVLAQKAEADGKADQAYLLLQRLCGRLQEVELPSASDFEAQVYEAGEKSDAAESALETKRAAVDDLRRECEADLQAVQQERRRRAEQLRV